MSKTKFPGELKSVEVEVNGSTWTLETGYIGKFAAGSVLLKAGGTVVMADVTYGSAQEGTDFFPLTVDYVEKLYAGGLISSSRFIKREGRAGTEETLTARMIDRSLRPLFPKGFYNPVQVVVTVLSYDPEFDPKVVGINAASAALSISGLPFEGPIAALRIGISDDKPEVYMHNMELEWDQNNTDMNLVFSARKEGIVMFDADANIIPEEKIVEGMRFGHEQSLAIIEAQEELAKQVAKPAIEFELIKPDEVLVQNIKEKFGKQIEESVMREESGDDSVTLSSIMDEIFAEFEGNYSKSAMSEVVDYIRKSVVKDVIVNTGKRIDGRALDEVRPVDIQLGILPRTHGSAVFTRGDTQAMTVTTLGSMKLSQTLQSIDGEDNKRYMHHYNMPPYATGEAGRFMLYPGRREIGHGALAEKAIIPVLPSETEFPYAIRVVSEITQSNGSSSMAATCGSSLSLMDAGVPIKSPVAGVAMGLIMEDPDDVENSKYHVLTDILGMEDFGGHMDFKVTGTREGVTAIQLDNKLKYVPIDVLADAIEKAKAGRMKFMDEMDKIISEPKTDMSVYAPRIETLKIAEDKIGLLIGPGGKNIKNISEVSGAEINIDDDGTVSIAAVDGESRNKAVEMIEATVGDVEVGEIYKGKVEKIMDFGAFVELPGQKSGLVHVSELSDEYVKDVNDFVKEGQDVTVKVIGEKQGKISLTMKGVDQGSSSEDDHTTGSDLDKMDLEEKE